MPNKYIKGGWRKKKVRGRCAAITRVFSVRREEIMRDIASVLCKNTSQLECTLHLRIYIRNDHSPKAWQIAHRTTTVFITEAEYIAARSLSYSVKPTDGIPRSHRTHSASALSEFGPIIRTALATVDRRRARPNDRHSRTKYEPNRWTSSRCMEIRAPLEKNVSRWKWSALDMSDAHWSPYALVCSFFYSFFHAALWLVFILFILCRSSSSAI